MASTHKPIVSSDDSQIDRKAWTSNYGASYESLVFDLAYNNNTVMGSSLKMSNKVASTTSSSNDSSELGRNSGSGNSPVLVGISDNLADSNIGINSNSEGENINTSSHKQRGLKQIKLKDSKSLDKIGHEVGGNGHYYKFGSNYSLNSNNMMSSNSSNSSNSSRHDSSNNAAYGQVSPFLVDIMPYNQISMMQGYPPSNLTQRHGLSSMHLKQMVSSTPNLYLRKGKWTVEEDEYADKIIRAFNEGLLKPKECPSGTTLRSYLAEKLRCDPMRITKKYKGTDCLGKKAYVEHRGTRTIDPVARAEHEQKVAIVMAELSVLEQRFLAKDEEESMNPSLPFDKSTVGPMGGIVRPIPTAVVNPVLDPAASPAIYNPAFGLNTLGQPVMPIPPPQFASLDVEVFNDLQFQLLIQQQRELYLKQMQVQRQIQIYMQMRLQSQASMVLDPHGQPINLYNNDSSSSNNDDKYVDDMAPKISKSHRSYSKKQVPVVRNNNAEDSSTANSSDDNCDGSTSSLTSNSNGNGYENSNSNSNSLNSSSNSEEQLHKHDSDRKRSLESLVESRSSKYRTEEKLSSPLAASDARKESR